MGVYFFRGYLGREKLLEWDTCAHGTQAEVGFREALCSRALLDCMQLIVYFAVDMCS